MSDNMVYEMSEYFRRLNDSLEEQQKHVAKNPPREVQLLRAMKAFMPEANHANADRLIDMMMMVSTCEKLQQESIPPEASVHHDGVYDIDSSCVRSRKGMNGAMLLALAAMARG